MAEIDPRKGEKISRERLRDVVAVSRQVSESGTKVYPGDRWALHYTEDTAARQEKLQGLMAGRYSAADVAASLKPDALLYDASDFEREDAGAVLGRIQDEVNRIDYFDYERFASFLSRMSVSGVPLDALQRIYSGIQKNRTRKQFHNAYGWTGKKRVEAIVRAEMEGLCDRLSGMDDWSAVCAALSADFACEGLGLIRTNERDAIVSGLDTGQRKVFESVREHVRSYVERGSERAFESIMESLKGEEPQKEPFEPSEEMQKLQEELEDYIDDVGPPGSSEDPAIPPDDCDEYNDPGEPGQSGSESREKEASQAFFEIEPAGVSTKPLVGYYCSGRKSYYDVPRKTWSKKKQLTSYSGVIAGDERWKISGTIEGDVKALPIPNGYALDMSSLSGGVQVFRDQNGCFYVHSSVRSSFSVDFLKDPNMHVGMPIQEDLAQIYSGSLSGGSEAVLKQIQSLPSPAQKADLVREHILGSHFYPGGGDLKAAQALQHKLRSESSAVNYLQNLDASEYLECYSANTLFVAMMRKAGVQARLVVGHMLDGSNVRDGKSVIDQSTGHAWSEIWDGSAWVRYDATPKPKPEDKDPSQDSGDSGGQGEMENADDGGSQEEDGQPQDGGSQESGEAGDMTKDVQDQVDQRVEEVESSSSDSSEGMPEASDTEMSEAEAGMEEATQEMEAMEEKKREMEKQVKQVEKFQDLQDLKDQLENEDLFEDMKDSVEDLIDKKEEQMKDEIRDRLEDLEDAGFVDEKRREELEDKLDELDLNELDNLLEQIDRESALYEKYEEICEEVMPYVEEWYRYIAEKLPRKLELELDEETLMRQGKLNRRSVHRYSNLLFGTVYNPRVYRASVKPKFLASIVLDVSGSMSGEKLQNALKLLVFYCELFNMISAKFGYIRFSIKIFADGVWEIKDFGQDYDSSTRYDFMDGTSSTIKVRLMTAVQAGGGTNMLEAIQKSARDMTEETWEYPDYASALNFIGDGGDTCGNTGRIRQFIETKDEEDGFGNHMHFATFLGDEAQRQVLADIFGDEHTSVASDFEELIGVSMEQFGDQIEEYVDSMS
ncbi:hypothetical protein KKC94_02175 [Patescibacteria group bacterium]|nr:hypothetical protein [Patescibacteria group bacterium]